MSSRQFNPLRFSSCLPDWALDLPQHFPFLFPFATRYNFLQSTSFGYARLILKWQSQQSRGQDTSRRDEGIGFLGRLQRQKVRISRKHILESAVKVFELYGSSSSVLEVEYFDEVGTGLGPTLEFYSLVSQEFARRDLKIWRDADQSQPGPYVHHPQGLFSAPISPGDMANDGGQCVHLSLFRVKDKLLIVVSCHSENAPIYSASLASSWPRLCWTLESLTCPSIKYS